MQGSGDPNWPEMFGEGVPRYAHDQFLTRQFGEPRYETLIAGVDHFLAF
jgi:hypothetical protein